MFRKVVSAVRRSKQRKKVGESLLLLDTSSVRDTLSRFPNSPEDYGHLPRSDMHVHRHISPYCLRSLHTSQLLSLDSTTNKHHPLQNRELASRPHLR